MTAKNFFWTGLLCLALTTIFSTWSLWTFRESQALRRSSSAMQAALDDVLESLQAADIALLMYQRSESPHELQRFALSYEAVQKELTILEAQYLTMKRQGYVDEPIEKAIQLLAILIQEKSGLLLGMVNRHQDPLDFEDLSRLLEQDLATSQAIEEKIQGLDRLLVRQAQAHEAFLEKNRNLMITSNFLLMFASVALLAGGWWGMSREIKRRTKVETELRAAQEVAIRASRQKSDFLAAMSHEIRTPLNGILGLSELMAREGKGEMKRRAMVIHQSGEVLLRLVNEVLDLAKIEAGKLDLEINKVQLSELIESACDLFASKAREKRLKLRGNYDVNSEAYFATDGSRVSQILNNLLGNAIKFTENGSVEIFSRVTRKQDGFYEWRIDVKDTGPGVAVSLRPFLFEQFRQGAEARGEEGSGLGLSISQALAKKMGGEISYEPAPEGGSVFRLSLPLSYLESPPAGPAFTGESWVCLGIPEEERALIEDCAFRSEAKILFLPANGGFGDDDSQICRVFFGESGLSSADRFPGKSYFLGDPSTCPPWAISVFPLTIGRLKRVMVAQEEGSGSGVEMVAVPMEKSKLSTVPRVLLVEDNPTNQMLAQAILNDAGYQVLVASEGESAVAMATEETFHLVLMDCRLPGIDGFEATRRIRDAEAAKKKRRVAIVALTANLAITDRDRCLAAGMDDFLAKPFKREDLLAKVEQWTSESLVVDWSVLHHLASKSSPDLSRRLVASFLLSLDKAIVALGKANVTKEEVVYLSHQLKSSAASVGALPFSKKMREIETLAEQGKDYNLLLGESLKEAEGLKRILSGFVDQSVAT